MIVSVCFGAFGVEQLGDFGYEASHALAQVAASEGEDLPGFGVLATPVASVFCAAGRWRATPVQLLPVFDLCE
jgi:hypothetical protein